MAATASFKLVGTASNEGDGPGDDEHRRARLCHRGTSQREHTDGVEAAQDDERHRRDEEEQPLRSQQALFPEEDLELGQRPLWIAALQVESSDARDDVHVVGCQVVDTLQNLDEILAHLNHVDSHRQGSYNFPFHPLAPDEQAYVFRFDCGRFGWQFDLLYGEDQRVTEVRRRWIH